MWSAGKSGRVGGGNGRREREGGYGKPGTVRRERQGGEERERQGVWACGHVGMIVSMWACGNVECGEVWRRRWRARKAGTARRRLQGGNGEAGTARRRRRETARRVGVWACGHGCGHVGMWKCGVGSAGKSGGDGGATAVAMSAGMEGRWNRSGRGRICSEMRRAERRWEMRTLLGRRESPCCPK